MEAYDQDTAVELLLVRNRMLACVFYKGSMIALTVPSNRSIQISLKKYSGLSARSLSLCRGDGATGTCSTPILNVLVARTSKTGCWKLPN
jgi:hypothetical protein